MAKPRGEAGPVGEPGTPGPPGIAIAQLSPYATVTDLIEALGSKDALLDAYVQGWLPRHAEEALESNATRLLCWLTARLLRLELGRQP